MHKLAGGALNLGVSAAGRTGQQIELVADTGSTDGAAELIDLLEAQLEDGRTALLAYQAAYSSSVELRVRAGRGRVGMTRHSHQI